MKKVILPTAYFPSCSYISSLLRTDEVIIEVHETFPKQTFRNRCAIGTSQERFILSIPLKGRRNNDRTIDIYLSESTPWREHHWRSIQTAYGSSPFFIHYETELRSLLFTPTEKLVDLNLHITRGILKILKQSVSLSFSSTYEKQAGEETIDLRRSMFQEKDIPIYLQVFSNKTGFIPDLSIIDLIFNLGPEAINYLKALK